MSSPARPRLGYMEEQIADVGNVVQVIYGVLTMGRRGTRTVEQGYL